MSLVYPSGPRSSEKPLRGDTEAKTEPIECQFIPSKFQEDNKMSGDQNEVSSEFWHLVKANNEVVSDKVLYSVARIRYTDKEPLLDELKSVLKNKSIRIRFLVLKQRGQECQALDLHDPRQLFSPLTNMLSSDQILTKDTISEVRYMLCFEVLNESLPTYYYLYQYRFIEYNLETLVDQFEQLLTLRDIVYTDLIPIIKENKNKIIFNNQEIDANKLGLKNIFIPQFDELGPTWGPSALEDIVKWVFCKQKRTIRQRQFNVWGISESKNEEVNTILARRGRGLRFAPFGAVGDQYAAEILELDDISQKRYNILSLDAHKALIGPYYNKTRMREFERIYNTSINPSQNKEPEISNVPTNLVNKREIIPMDFQKANNMGSENSANFWYLSRITKDAIVNYPGSRFMSYPLGSTLESQNFIKQLQNSGKIKISCLVLNKKSNGYVDLLGDRAPPNVPLDVFAHSNSTSSLEKTRYMLCFELCNGDPSNTVTWCLWHYKDNSFGSNLVDSFEQLLTLRDILHTYIIPMIIIGNKTKIQARIIFNGEEIPRTNLGLKNIFIPQFDKLGQTWGKLSADDRTKYYFNDNTWTELKSAETETTSGQGNQPGVIPNEYAARILELGDVSQGYELLSFKAHKALIGPYLDKNNYTFTNENNFKEACKTYVQEINVAKKLDVLPQK